MAGQDTISGPALDGRRLRGRPAILPRRRLLLLALALSIAAHLTAAFMVVFLPRALPREPKPQAQGAVELLKVEQQGAKLSQPDQPQQSLPAAPQPQADTSKQEDTNVPATPPEIAPPPVAEGDEPPPRPTKATPEATSTADQSTAAPQAPPQSQKAPVFDLAGTESESNAVVLGGRVLPAMPDDRFRNRPPIYPREAAARGQQGAVLVLIHVSAAGLATGVDVVESSGVSVLDQAAVSAVRKWHFHPAMQAGRAVPFDMPFRIIFDAL
ncbi:MAG TPA: energy transducer TonB [Rhodopila sp.]|jgi:protein TonB